MSVILYLRNTGQARLGCYNTLNITLHTLFRVHDLYSMIRHIKLFYCTLATEVQDNIFTGGEINTCAYPYQIGKSNFWWRWMNYGQISDE